MFGHEPDMLCPRDSAEYAGLLVGVLDAFTGEEGGTAVGELDNDRGVDVSGGLQHGVDGGGGSAVERY